MAFQTTPISCPLCPNCVNLSFLFLLPSSFFLCCLTFFFSSLYTSRSAPWFALLCFAPPLLLFSHCAFDDIMLGHTDMLFPYSSISDDWLFHILIIFLCVFTTHSVSCHARLYTNPSGWHTRLASLYMSDSHMSSLKRSNHPSALFYTCFTWLFMFSQVNKSSFLCPSIHWPRAHIYSYDVSLARSFAKASLLSVHTNVVSLCDDAWYGWSSLLFILPCSISLSH